MAFPGRANDNTELFRRLTQVGIIRDATGTFGSSTLSGAEARGSAAVDVAAITNFSDTDLIRIGSGSALEENEVAGAPAGSTITLAAITDRDHMAGEAVVERNRVNIGHVEEGGITIAQSHETFEVRAATSQTPLIRRTTNVPQDITFPGLNFSVENLALACGLDEAAAQTAVGSGTAVAPYRVRWNADFMEALQNISLYASGVLEGGDFIEVLGFGLEFDLNKNIQLAQNAATSMIMGGRVHMIEWRVWT